jgi:uncharacterized protein (DUF427 family)
MPRARRRSQLNESGAPRYGIEPFDVTTPARATHETLGHSELVDGGSRTDFEALPDRGGAWSIGLRPDAHVKNPLPDWARRRQGTWRWVGKARPPFAIEPGPGQESVWDYPRPPRLEPDSRRVTVRSGDTVIADTRQAIRVLETASPPTFYIPPADIRLDLFREAPGGSRCEWKGAAVYHSIEVPEGTLDQVAWSYPYPFPAFRDISGHVSFYPDVLECYVGVERVRPQPGGFYGGWITSEVVGPFKGAPGSEGW